ncbi:MAG: HigA family addiction module antitoxin [Caldimonas sp.]
MSELKMHRAPTHPGEILRRDMLPAMKVTQAQFAEMLGLSRQTVSSILAGTSPVSAETALKLGTLFGNSPQFWMNLQSSHDLWMVQQQMEPAVLKRLDALHGQYIGAGRGG